MTKSKRLLLSALLLGGCLCGVIWHNAQGAEIKKPPQGPTPVSVIQATARDVPVYLNGIGNIQAMQSAVVRAQIDGQLMDVHFIEGQQIEKGAPLAEIDARSTEAALEKAEADRINNIAQLQTAKLDYTRYKNLLKDDAIAQQKVDQQKAMVDQLDAAVKVSQSEINIAKVQLSYAHITSPISGRVGIRHVDPGNIVKATDPDGIVTITQVDPITAIFALPQENLHELQPLLQSGQEIPVDILPKEGGHVIASGKLLTVDNQINETTGTVKMKAIIPNEKFTLWPGQFVIARIAAKTLSGHPVLPIKALQQGLDKPYVYRVKGDTAEAVNVEVLYQDDDIVVLGDSVQPNDIIVTDGQSRVKPGGKIQIIPDKQDASAPAASVPAKESIPATAKAPQ